MHCPCRRPALCGARCQQIRTRTRSSNALSGCPDRESAILRSPLSWEVYLVESVKPQTSQHKRRACPRAGMDTRHSRVPLQWHCASSFIAQSHLVVRTLTDSDFPRQRQNGGRSEVESSTSVVCFFPARTISNRAQVRVCGLTCQVHRVLTSDVLLPSIRQPRPGPRSYRGAPALPDLSVHSHINFSQSRRFSTEPTKRVSPLQR